MRGFGRIRARFHLSLLEEVPPALVTVRRGLAYFIFLHCRLCVLLALDHFHHARGLIGPDVVADHEVGSTDFFACQSSSVWGIFRQLCSNKNSASKTMIRKQKGSRLKSPDNRLNAPSAD